MSDKRGADKMQVMVEVRTEIWQEVLGKLIALGFTRGVPETPPINHCKTAVLIVGFLPKELHARAEEIPGVVAIWEDVQLSTLL